MAINVEERIAQLDSLNSFIESSREKFTSILSILGWDVDNLREKVSYKDCALYCTYAAVMWFVNICLLLTVPWLMNSVPNITTQRSAIKPERQTSVGISQ